LRNRVGEKKVWSGYWLMGMTFCAKCQHECTILPGKGLFVSYSLNFRPITLKRILLFRSIK
jgi:hypothetical protein